MRTIRQLEPRGQRVLVRVDYNVPMTPQGTVADTLRIEESLPTLRWLKERGARLVLMSHLGRPKGASPGLSLRPIAESLSNLIGTPVHFANSCVGADAQEQSRTLKDGEVLLLENLRFDAREEANDASFAQDLARLGDCFVEDAFGTVHRAHASTVGVPEILPAYAGFLVEREVEELSKLTRDPKKPYTAVIGGAKIQDKLPLLKNLLDKIDHLLLGGALGASVITDSHRAESPLHGPILDLLESARRASVQLLLPEDFILQDGPRGAIHVSADDKVPAGSSAMDIGPRTRANFRKVISSSKTVFVNGPLGKAEEEPFSHGTREVLGGLPIEGCTRILAGGDTAGIIRTMGLGGSFSYISTGGGAALEFIEGRELPGLRVLPHR